MATAAANGRPFGWVPWALVAAIGAAALGIVALHRGETINALWLVVAAVCVYLTAYRFYATFIARKVLGIDPSRRTPAVRHNDGLDYVPTHRNVLFGHHFAAIAGAGPLVGPVLAAQMGYLPGTLWILVGVVFAGAVQDFLMLFISTRRDGRSLGEIIRAEMGNVPGVIAMIGILMIMIILLAVLALVVVKALAESPWGTFTVFATMPIALFMGLYGRYIRPGRIGEVSLIGLVGLLLAIILGEDVAASASWGPAFTFSGEELALMLIGYGFVASVIPVWLLLAPRDYLSTFLKIGTIVGLAIGILIVRPELQMPAVTRFIDGSGPVFAGNLFPFLFITIACGAVSGFSFARRLGNDAQDDRERGPFADDRLRRDADGKLRRDHGAGRRKRARSCHLLRAEQPSRADRHHDQRSRAGSVRLGLHRHAGDAGPGRLTGRRSDDPVPHRRRADPRRRHGQYPFERRRRARHDGLLVPFRHPVRGLVHPHHRRCRHARGAVHDPGSPRHVRGAVEGHQKLDRQPRGNCARGRRLGLVPLPGVTDPLGGINTLWPLFGISNQMLAAIALTLCTVVLFRMKRERYAWVTLLPLSWLLICTLTAGWQKMFHADPKIGFLAHASKYSDALARGEILAPAKSVAQMRQVIFNDYVNASLCALFIAVVLAIVFYGIRSVVSARRSDVPTTREVADALA